MDAEIKSFLNELNKYTKDVSTDDTELLQHLVELGYLNVDHLRMPDLPRWKQKALDNFNLELNQSELINAADLRLAKSIYADDSECYFLRQLKDIDEGILFNSLPEPGDRNLCTRMIHYRLDIIGMLDGPVDKPFDIISFNNLEKLGETIGIPDPLMAINTMADMENLTRSYVEKIGKENCLLVFQLPEVPDKIRKFEKRSAFLQTLDDEFSRRSDFFRMIKDDVIRKKDKKVDFEFLKERMKSGENMFLIRLIQVHQWIDGFYKGLLDSELGEVSFSSLLNSINLFNNDDEEEDVKSKEVIFHAGNGYIIFNALFFIEKYMIEEQKLDYQNEVISILNKNLQTASGKDRQNFEKHSTDFIKASINSKKGGIKERKGLLQRIYYGVKSFFKKAFKVGAKIFRWIKNNVKRVAGFLGEFFKKMFANIGKALYFIKEGILYIIGKNPLVMITESRQVMASKILIDGDATCFISERCNEADIVKYRKQTSEKINAMVFSLKVFAALFKTIQHALAVVSWPLLLLNIVKSFNEISTEFKLINA